MTRKVKRKKLKVGRVILVLFILILLIILLSILIKIPVLGFYISGNTYYTDQEILDKTKLSSYPSFFLTSSFSVNSKVKNDKLIDNIKIKKTIFLKFKVIVNEKKILFYNLEKKKSVVKDGDDIDYYDKDSPVLVNNISSKKIYSKLIEKMSKVDSDILKNISEIKYDPNDIDDERFLISMNDGNYVYLTISKFSNINNYVKISRTLGDKNGILYLDYGNYFVPKE